MLKYVDYDIVFQEIPDEVTLAINLSNCPYCCVGCHSPHLREDIGEELSEAALSDLISKYENAITCVCFMGGDATPEGLCKLAAFVRKKWNGAIKIAWYSGNNTLYNKEFTRFFNYIKLGEFIQTLGGLNKNTTNQRLYRINNDTMEDITPLMQR
ncbi:MAG TPA: anaerobic ribonucleoside-triphosphate reductase activating protein [Bacteroidales bacterium]|jgi:anaerobic ribonucleoside-triphosphate reductase activating protein|nr:anaerobic ribonucleoside-triphosphate reductase activating protein [Bacteroidales bacterium]HPB89398.1 anaerobic ribonucleoside-triphosphate reductase activating protein [Bacteroidales bacterium]HPY21975.1 anaerobic ribonucleoside-triphosphate reductase activating protein [Bacteroidales bacterium]HQA92717.1 anaerobic ribonucleoside-triphosphate reductase activating protein [Bacteroidales bacterium]HQN24200.1 anaerobic ribonucleoside-triphosphate reductase activating protein [Bacteroidales ba